MPKDLDPRPCSIADALRVVGGTWTLLVIRELFYNANRFDAIVRNTGISRDILATRLRALTDAGVVSRERYHDHPPRYEYGLTAKGRDLTGVLFTLMNWGDTHLNADAPPVRWTHSCGSTLTPVVVCGDCREPAKDHIHSPTGHGAVHIQSIED
ncbi:MAG: helix-turn-helix transcriptional regulator [Actinomycetota bacterium]|nr:helix-turn-helix transcriptional regulator [Actinomycetota bacterium]